MLTQVVVGVGEADFLLLRQGSRKIARQMSDKCPTGFINTVRQLSDTIYKGVRQLAMIFSVKNVGIEKELEVVEGVFKIVLNIIKGISPLKKMKCVYVYQRNYFFSVLHFSFNISIQSSKEEWIQ